MASDERRLPVIQEDADDGAPSCSPKIYVSNEEAALLAGMRDLRERSHELKKRMTGADPERLARLKDEIEALRAEWNDLSAQREKAFVRKMIMLGHLPPDHPVTSNR